MDVHTRIPDTAPFAIRTLAQIAEERGIAYSIEPEWGYFLQIPTRKGSMRYARNTSIDVNAFGAAALAKDKDFTLHFLRARGIPTVRGTTCFSDTWAHHVGSDATIESGVAYAKKVGFPCIVKPNARAQGEHVFLAQSEAAARHALAHIFLHNTVARIEEFFEGRDMRFVVFDETVYCAYERIPLSIHGDGVRTVAALFHDTCAALMRAGRHISVSISDERIHTSLNARGYTHASVPKDGEHIVLLANANLSSGGSAKDHTDTVHASWKDVCITIARTMGLRLCGIDILTKIDPTQPADINQYVVLEVNASPGLEHFASLGAIEAQRVHALYDAVLSALVTPA